MSHAFQADGTSVDAPSRCVCPDFPFSARLCVNQHHWLAHRMEAEGIPYRLCVLFLKLFERVSAPLTAGLLRPVAAAAALPEDKRHRLARLYPRIVTDLDALWRAVGLRLPHDSQLKTQNS